MMFMKKTRPKAILFIEYKLKNDTIESAKDLGYRVVLITQKATDRTLELFDEVIEIDITDREAIDEKATFLKKKYNVKCIISNYEDFVVQRSYLSELFSLPSCSVYSACCTRNKIMQRHALKFMKENISHRIIKSEKSALRAFKALGEDIFIKSIAGVKSKFIFHVKTQEELSQAFAKLDKASLKINPDLYSDFAYCDFNFTYPDPNTTFLAEKAEYGDMVSVESLIDSYRIWHAPSMCDNYTARQIGRDDSFIAFRILPSKFSAVLDKRVKDVVETAVRILGMRFCAAHTELFITKNGEIKIIETGSRLGGYRPLMYQEAYGINLSTKLLYAALNKKISSNKRRKKFVSLMEIFPEESGQFRAVDGMEELKTDDRVSHLKQKDIGFEVGLARDGFPPVLSFLISADSYEEAYEKSCYYQKRLKVVTS